ncbi:LAFA_0A01486g1_1 [Lachancea sp. 'fantastica']|nr:LAFA_0A01486g1_1 [Lachancea sp. 'fantastica']
MSVCLAVTKTIAVSSLGIYCGTMCSATILAQFTPLDVVKSQLMGPAKIVARVAASLATVSSIFFGLSFFGAPASLHHPYLLYGMLVAPVSAAYMGLTMSFRRPRKCREQCSKRAEKQSTTAPTSVAATEAQETPDLSLDESVVDLGQSTASHDEDETTVAATTGTTTGTTTTTQSDHVTAHSSKCLRPIPVLFGISVLGFVQSVLGLYGEGLFV